MRLVDMKRPTAHLYYGKGVIFSDQRTNEEVMVAYDKAINLDPEYVKYYEKLQFTQKYASTSKLRVYYW
jgi:hypothetical protein